MTAAPSYDQRNYASLVDKRRGCGHPDTREAIEDRCWHGGEGASRVPLNWRSSQWRIRHYQICRHPRVITCLLCNRSCPSSVRVNTRGRPGDRHKDPKAETRGAARPPSGPLSPGDALDTDRADACRRRRLPPRAASHPAVCSHPHWLGPRGHPIPPDLAQAPDLIGPSGCHRRRAGRHCVAEPVPLVGRGRGRGWRTLAWGRQTW